MSSLTARYVRLDGTNSMSGALAVAGSINITGVDTSPQSLYFRGTDYNVGIAAAAGNYSSWTAKDDMVIRTLATKKLILQSGSDGAICINSSNNVGIGTNNPNALYKLDVSGNINGTNIYEGGRLLSSNYLSSATLANYLLKTGDTMTGDLTFNKTNLDIRLSATNGNNIAIPSTNGWFSTSAVANEFVIRSLQSLIIQNGGGAYALKIGTNNLTYINKQFYIESVPADTKAVVDGRIFATFPTMATVFWW